MDARTGERMTQPNSQSPQSSQNPHSPQSPVNPQSSPIHMVQSDADFRRLLEVLEQADVCALDLEFDKNYHRYGFHLCLLQIAIGNECFLVDPLQKEFDLSPLYRHLERPDLTKLVFSFGEDLRLLQSLGCRPSNLIDLNHYVRLLNYPQRSLSNLLLEQLGLDLDSGEQLSNWYARPLTSSQILYAANDVLHLQTLYNQLHPAAEEKGVDSWVQQENHMAEQADYSGLEQESLFKEKEQNLFDEHTWHLYERLLRWRDKVARGLNLPAFKVMDKAVLDELARKPGKASNWATRRGIHPRLRTRTTQTEVKRVLEDALQEADAMGLSSDQPARKKPDSEVLKQIRKEQSQVSKVKRGLFGPVKQCLSRDYGEETSTFVFSNRIITEFVRENPREMLPYKVELIRKYASELRIPVERYLRLPPM